MLAALPHSNLVGGDAALKRSAIKTVAFDYAAIAPVEDLHFYAKFDLLVTGAILAPNQLRLVHSRATRLVVYQWASAHYVGEGGTADRRWEQSLSSQASSWLLSSRPISGGAADPAKLALWYDFGNPALVAAFVEYIYGLVKTNRYSGVFLDTLGFKSLPSELQLEFHRRHPGMDYDQVQGEFIGQLRKSLGPHAIIFTNQGYRNPHAFLPHSDFDLIENSSTLLKPDGSTKFRPWFKRGCEWESIAIPMTNLVEAASELYPDVKFVHINYVQGDHTSCERAVSYSYACAKLWDHLSFVAPPGVQTALPNNVYFHMLGPATTDSYVEDREAGVAWREFRHGIVAINTSKKPYRIASLGLDLPDPPRGYIFSKTS
jgi:hypothetical protein